MCAIMFTERKVFMDSICRFLPPKSVSGNIKTVHFVYETEFLLMKQPFIRPIYYLHLVTSGEATLKFSGKQYPLKEGTLFFFFSGVPYEIEGDENFRYTYVSFMGANVPEFLAEMGITVENSVFQGYSHLKELWLSSIVRVNNVNANILTESVLLNTLSYIANNKEKTEPNKNSENLLSVIVDYVDTHYREKELSLKKVAKIFAYTEKYLSHFFKSKMGTGFNEYVNNLRLQNALNLIDEGNKSVTEIASKCGFSDPLYFSKCFKRKMGKSPTEYIKNN